jgi:hypothetical protein
VVALAAAVAFGLLLASTQWVLLGAVSAWLALAWATCRPDGRAVSTGLALAAVLAAGALVFSLGGGLGIEVGLRRALRAALLVLVATWLRSAAGAEGLREVSRRALHRLRRLPAVPQAARILDGIGSEGRITAAGRSLLGRLEGVPSRPVPFVDAVLGWVAAESSGYRRPDRARRERLRTRPLDAVLLLAAAAPALALA